MITCKQFPGKTFNSKEEVFKHLRENVSKIIAVKKATIHKSFENGCVFSGFLLKEDGNIGKVGPQMKEDYIYPVINTTRYLDMHDDAHFDGIWNKSVKEQNGKIFYVTDHETKIDSIIAWPEDVNVMVKSVPWSFVGKDYQGNTEALIYEIPKDKLVHEGAKKIIEDKRPVQNSVRMQYVTIKLAMNSTAKEDITYKEYYDKRINEIANKDVAEAQGYFFGIEEAKIVTEGSMVIRGSNDATPIRQKDTVAVDDTTEKIEPPVGTQAKQSIFSNLKLVR
jgi:hypothetical protein